MECTVATVGKYDALLAHLEDMVCYYCRIRRADIAYGQLR